MSARVARGLRGDPPKLLSAVLEWTSQVAQTTLVAHDSGGGRLDSLWQAGGGLERPVQVALNEARRLFREHGTAIVLDYAHLMSVALLVHPDKCQLSNAEEAFKRVSAAYAALQDGRNVRFGEDGASSDTPYNYGAYSDEAELFRAMFAGDGSLLTRLVSVFRANPWTLLALVSALQSLGNIVSMVVNRPEALLRCVVVVGALYAASDRFKR